MTARARVHVGGAVQGVGFRPYVHALATGLGLNGFVGNDGDGVFAEVEGEPDAVSDFARRLSAEAPPLAAVESLTVRAVPVTGEPGFTIVPSQTGTGAAMVLPDAAMCADCERELWDPGDRRYQHPFITCTNCGPRYTIVNGLPYDRPRTTMAGFTMCKACAREYGDSADRRFHAQPVCCPDCGPRLTGPGIDEAARLLLGGGVLAVKGLGGYHLAVDATNATAVAALRDRKHRPDQAFAVMVSDLAMARELCLVGSAAEALLTGPAAPIVVLERRPGPGLPDVVSPGVRTLGLMLPYTPLHRLLLDAVRRPCVMTSGNPHGEPIVHEDARAREELSADAFLGHDRPIQARAEDSVMRVFRGEPYPVRRSRGLAPAPIRLRRPAGRPVLACGAMLKNTFCLATGDRAVLSPHLGDLSGFVAQRVYAETINHFQRLYGVRPEIVAHDLHPDYPSTRYALAWAAGSRIGVQHHHAHIAACLADNGVAGPVIGVAFDGLGYGPDGALWGGEFLVADLTGFTREGHLRYVPMPGADMAVREPWRMTAAYLPDDDLAVARRHEDHWQAIRAMAERGLNAPPTSSAGRLFDAAAALLGVRDVVSYEGQAAIELEAVADRAEPAGYHAPIEQRGTFRVSGAALLSAAAEDLAAGTPVPVIAMRFHRAVATLIGEGCELVRSRTGIAEVALSGGVFQNTLLLDLALTDLAGRGFRTLIHRRVPCNDGGVSLGQAAVAAAVHG